MFFPLAEACSIESEPFMPPKVDAPTLARYLVGDLPPDEMQAVQSWLKEHPDVRLRLYGTFDESEGDPEWNKEAALRRFRELSGSEDTT